MNQKLDYKESKSLLNSKQIYQMKLFFIAGGLFNLCSSFFLLFLRKVLTYGWKFIIMMAIVLVMLGVYYLIKYRLNRYFAINKFYWWLLVFRTVMATSLLVLVLAMRPVVYHIAN